MFEVVLFDNGLEQAVTAMVQSGFYTCDEIVEFFHEIAVDDPDAGLNPDTIDEDVRKFVMSAASSLSREAASWPDKTDNDRLEEAFQDLNEAGIRAVQNYGYEASDCGELYSEIRGNSQWRGYCFYHNQDLVRAVRGGDLLIRFSSAADRPTDDDNCNIAKIILDALRAHDLHPEWNGDPTKTISLPMAWQRRPATSEEKQCAKVPSKPWWKVW